MNFNELYDESYMGGKEYLRVLNELIREVVNIKNSTHGTNMNSGEFTKSVREMPSNLFVRRGIDR